MSPSLAAIKDHYSCFWNSIGTEIRWTGGRFAELPPGFSVLEFPPSAKRPFWTYASCGMSVQADAPPLETFLLSERQDASIAELITALAHSHYHVTGAYLGLSHTVNFGRPWLDDSTCDHGLLSLPYLDGTDLEWQTIAGRKTQFLWLIPVTKKEIEFKSRCGLDALEQLFESTKFNYLDPSRKSVIA